MRLNANTDNLIDYRFNCKEIEEAQLERAYEWFENSFDFEEKEEMREEFEKDPVKFWREGRCDV